MVSEKAVVAEANTKEPITLAKAIKLHLMLPDDNPITQYKNLTEQDRLDLATMLSLEFGYEIVSAVKP